MNPEEIVEAAFDAGVTLYLADGRMKAHGKLPENWIQLAEVWHPYRQQVIEWLTDCPSKSHKLRMARVAITLLKMRTGLPCIHLGEMIEAKPSCGCGARHHCAIHGECVVSGSTNKWRVCSRCADYESER